jgi:hypothetical protein
MEAFELTVGEFFLKNSQRNIESEITTKAVKFLGARPGDGDAFGAFLASIWDKQAQAFRAGYLACIRCEINKTESPGERKSE